MALLPLPNRKEKQVLPSNPFIVPDYLKAGSPEELKKGMLRNNLERGYEFKYFDIQYVEGVWYCWYYHNIETETKNGRQN